MHRIVGRPILYSLVVAMCIYAIPLLIVEVSGSADEAASIVSGILMLLIAAVASVFEYLFFREHFDPHKDPVALSVSIWGILNTLFVTTHIVANVGYAIWLFDLSPGKDQVFLGVPGTGANGGAIRRTFRAF